LLDLDLAGRIKRRIWRLNDPASAGRPERGENQQFRHRRHCCLFIDARLLWRLLSGRHSILRVD
jgi:hypothetical protein